MDNSTRIILFIILVVLLLFIYQANRIEKVPRREYLRTIFEWQLFLKQDWINEILIHHSVSDLLKKKMSNRRNSFNLRQMVREGLIEHKVGETGLSGEIVIPVATFKITKKGLDEYQGSPS